MKASHERVIAHAAMLDLRKSLRERNRLVSTSESGTEFRSLYASLTPAEKDLLQAAIEFTKPRQPTWLDRQKEKFGW